MNRKLKISCYVLFIVSILSFFQVPIFDKDTGMLLMFISLLFFLLFYLGSKKGEAKLEFYAIILIMISFFSMIAITLFNL